MIALPQMSFRLDRLSPQARRMVPALAAFALSAALFVYNVVVAPDRALAAQALALSESIRAEDAALSAWLRDLNGSAVRPAETAAPDRNDLLKKLNAIAQQAGAHLVRVTPLPDNRGPIEIELEASFAGLVQFVGHMEARGGLLRRLRVHPRTADATFITAVFLLDWTPALAEAAIPPVAAQLLAGPPPPVDPFRSLANLSEASLRAGHRLTGITKTNDDMVATIDGRDYRIGDPIGDGTLTAIREDAVQLSSGRSRSWLHFQSR